MEDADLFLTPIPDVVDIAVGIAQEALVGELGDAAEKSYQAEFERVAEGSGLTLEEIDRLGAPRTAIGRLFERIQDWWWDNISADKGDFGSDEDLLEAAFAFPVPLLRTRPLQDTSFEYAEIDDQIAAATAEIVAAISEQTGWTPVQFQKPEPDDEEFDPMEQILAVWTTRAHPTFLVLVDEFEDDPKLMGCAQGLVHLFGKPAETFAARL